ncbi:hypothetical protein FRC15_010263 [Serendipita sp. 397]|nr:hypothetical protein FRC15_010263 [Serendipita sp. 397]KAG8796398.1 hypothetical protein FRC16_009720 [Serendipita sp. 398]
MKSITPLTYCVLLAVAIVTQAQPYNHNDILKRHEHHVAKMARDVEKRAPQGGIIPSFPGQPSSPTETSTTSTRGGGGGEGESTSTSREDPPEESTTTRSRSVSTPVDDPATSTSTSTPESTSTSSTAPSSSPSSQQQAASSSPRSTPVVSNTRFASQGSSYVASRSTATLTETASSDANSSGGSFLQNKSAVAATVTVAILVVIGALVFIAVWLKKKGSRSKMAEEDMWDEASMKEFSRPGGAGVPITPPPPAPVALADDGYHQQSGLTRSKTVLPSQSAGAGPPVRSRSQHSPPARREVDVDDEPDQILAMPPVTHFERPRDSAYDIVPAAPPAAAFASGAYASQGGGYMQDYSNAYASGSGSGGLLPPKRAGDHSSYGSGLGNDPFAGTGFVDATRESTYGPGQAGRGAGYNMNAPTENAGGPQMGNQWPQGYNQYTGYNQGNQSPYAGYGYAQ